MDDKVSVIMSTYNTPRLYLDEAIKSILDQTYTNIEFVIVCDGSKEEYQYIVKQYKDKRMKVLFNDKNMGLPYSLNRGIAESIGDYIARMDSDDISLPNRIEEELRFLKRNNLDLCGTAVYYFGDKNGRRRRQFYSREDIKVRMLFMATLMHPTVIGKKEIFKENNYNEKFVCVQDFELWSRLIDTYNIGYYDVPLLKYRIHSKQATISKSEIQKKMAEKIIRKNASKISGKYDDKVFRCLWLLGGREKITKSNHEEFSRLIDYTIKLNHKYKVYNEKSVEKIFYNRFFELTVKYKMPIRGSKFGRKIFHVYNFKDLMFFFIDGVKSKHKKHAIISDEDKVK